MNRIDELATYGWPPIDKEAPQICGGDELNHKPNGCEFVGENKERFKVKIVLITRLWGGKGQE